MNDRKRYQGFTILVIEDNQGVAQAVATRLKDNGYYCLISHSGSEALDTYSMNDIDLVITDLDLPGIDGCGVIGLIRAQSAIPIIVITGYSDNHEFFLSEFEDVRVLAKPFDHEVLCEFAHEMLAA